MQSNNYNLSYKNTSHKNTSRSQTYIPHANFPPSNNNHMSDPTKDSPNKPSLEELLRFKRAERPDEAFWEQFDGELHKRMMQALVKKDPWHVQVLRGLSGKFAQASAVAAASALLAVMVIRPAFITPESLEQSALAQIEIGADENAAAIADRIDSGDMAEADYEIEMLTATAADQNASVTRVFGLDQIEVASYETTAYSADMAFSGATSTGVASLVY